MEPHPGPPQLRATFDYFDADGNGVMDEAEFGTVAPELAPVLNELTVAFTAQVTVPSLSIRDTLIGSDEIMHLRLE